MFRGFRGYTRERFQDPQVSTGSRPSMLIEPQTDITIEEVKEYWDKKFQSLLDLPDVIDEGDEIDNLPEYAD